MRRSSGLRLVVATALIALGAVLFGTLGAPARSATVPSQVTISYDAATDSFSGTVRARGDCNAQRTVTVFERKTSKPRATKARRSKKKERARTTTIGSTTTPPTSTTWGPIANTGGSGSFFARVSATTSHGYGDSTTCLAARSRTIRVR